MKKLEDFLKELIISEKRSALYYLSRYIKQAEMFDKYQKDIFEDELHSRPSDKIKSLTLEMIKFIENTTKKKASAFNDEEFFYWMDKIAEIEDTIDIEPNEEQIKKAIDVLENFGPPPLKKL